MPLGGGVPDLPSGSPSGKGKPGGLIAPWLAPVALAATATQIGSASATATDEGRLDAALRSKLLNDDQRTYQSAFYRNRIDLTGQNPDQSSDWLSSQAQRLAHQQTGLTASGLPIDGANQWASGIANRAVNAGAETAPAMARLQRLLDQPLVIELRMDSNMVQAEVERRTDIQMRRGR